MIKAYVFVTTSREVEVLEAIKDIPEVEEAHLIYGNYDLIIVVRTDRTSMLKDVLTKSIRKIDNVATTMTMIALP